MRGEQRERLPRFGCSLERSVGMMNRTANVASQSAVPRPRALVLGAAEDGAAPGQPAVIGFEPGQGCREIAPIQRQMRREALQQQAILQDDAPRLGGGAL